MSKPLKLRATSTDDLQVMSALLQDAALRVDDMTWLPGEHRYVMVMNRYIHEKRSWFRKPKGERVRTGLHFNGVMKVATLGIDRNAGNEVLALLAIRVTDGEDGAAVIELDFSGGAAIRLDVECIDAVLHDLSESWDALARPRHDEA